MRFGRRQSASACLFTVVVGGALAWGLLLRDTPPPEAPDRSVTTTPPQISESSRGGGQRELVLLGSHVQVRVDGPDAARKVRAVVVRLRQLERKLSPVRPSSELARMFAADDPVRGGPDAQAFFASVTETQRALPTALPKPPWTKPQWTKSQPWLARTLLGYAASVVLTELRQAGTIRAAVVAGDDRWLLGRGAEAPWRFTVVNPHWPDRALREGFASDAAVSTFSAERGEPCASVTVVSARLAAASSWARGLCALGPDGALAWAAERPGTEILFVDPGGRARTTRGWREQVGPEEVAESRDLLASFEGGRGEAATVAIPSGSFLSGDAREPRSTGAFRIEKREVTNQRYRAFLDDTESAGHEHCDPDEPPEKEHTPRYWREFRTPLSRRSGAAALAPFSDSTFRRDDHPVVGIDWWDAAAFCRWAGRALPTQREWEKAARGDDGRIWPWGDRWDERRANTGGEKWGEKDGFLYAAPADSFHDGASVYGMLNAAGNVSEWTRDGQVAGGSSKTMIATMRSPRTTRSGSMKRALLCITGNRGTWRRMGAAIVPRNRAA